MQKLRKPLSILLSFVMILSVFTIVSFSASAVTTQIFARKWVKADLVTGDYFSFTALYQNFVVCRVHPLLFDETNFSTTQQGVYNKTADMSLGHGNEIILTRYNGSEMIYNWNDDQTTASNGKIYLSTNGDDMNFNTNDVEWYAYTWDTFDAQEVDAVAPTYSNGVYTNGTSEYYTVGDRLFAPVEGTTDGHQNTKQISSTDELAVPYFEFSDNGEQLSGYNGTDAEITLPETIPDNYPVAEWQGKSYGNVKDEAFKGNTTITKVTMPENVCHIGISAFENCTNIQEVYAGANLHYIDMDAFKGCTSMTKFYSVSPYAEDEFHVDNYAFDDKNSLTIYCRHGSFLAANIVDKNYDNVQVSYIDYTVTWNNWDDMELEKDQYVLEGETPTYDGKTPVRRNSDNTIYTFTGWTPEIAPVTGDVTYTATYSSRSDSKNATYIDADGEEQIVTATILGGHEPYEYYDYTYTYWLGEEGQTTWYVVEDDIEYNELLTDVIRIKGNVNLIIEDDASLTIEEIKAPQTDCERSLSIYGQTNQTGVVNAGKIARNYQFDALNICGATNNFGSIAGCLTALNMTRGKLNISGNVSSKTITLGCATGADRITIGSIKIESTLESVKIADGQTLQDDTRTYTGVLSVDDINALAGKTLMKAHEHDTAQMTFHEGVIPTYDPQSGTYINGTRAYYACETCGANFVEEDGNLVRKTAEELVLLYLRFRSYTVADYQFCEILEYNGTDAEVVIPDTVPSDYPDSGQRGNTVTGIGVSAFADKTFITSVTAGNDLNGIYENAFKGCTGLKTVTVGSSLAHIGTNAFKNCPALENFTSTATKDVSYIYLTEPEPQYSFDTDTNVVFHGPHCSDLYAIAKDFNCSFIPGDRHPDPTWEWAADYSSATAHFDCPSCPYQADLYAEATVSQSGDLTAYNVSVTTTDGYTYTDYRDSTIKFVKYIDKVGEECVTEAKIIIGNEASLGEAGKTSWYIAEGDIDFNNASLTLNGDVNLILADGAKLTGIGTISSADVENPVKFYVFGQNGQTGTMEAYKLEDLHSVVMYGGALEEVNALNANFMLACGKAKAGNINAGMLVVLSGDLVVFDNINASGSVSVSGGNLDVGEIDTEKLMILSGVLSTATLTVENSAFFAGGTTIVSGTAYVAYVTLGCKSADDSITVGNYQYDSDKAVFKVVTDQTLVDGLYTYSGTLTDRDINHMAGRKLVPAHEHTASEMTLHTAYAPSYDPYTKTYTNGNINYYTCPTCGGCLVEDGNNGFEYIDPVDTLVPYFEFEEFEGYYEITMYNGNDTDVVIPDTIPDNYPDSSLAGEKVEGIYSTAFGGNTTLTSVTAGDNCIRIDGESFKGCSALRTVTFSGLGYIGIEAFNACPALESFTSSSTKEITYMSDTFDNDTHIIFHGPHGSGLLNISQIYGSSSFVPTDRHVEPTWTWNGYDSATAVFDCGGTCEMNGGANSNFSAVIESTETATGITYTASVTVDGETYTDTKKRSYWKELQDEINSKSNGTLSEIRSFRMRSIQSPTEHCLK